MKLLILSRDRPAQLHLLLEQIHSNWRGCIPHVLACARTQLAEKGYRLLERQGLAVMSDDFSTQTIAAFCDQSPNALILLLHDQMLLTGPVPAYAADIAMKDPAIAGFDLATGGRPNRFRRSTSWHETVGVITSPFGTCLRASDLSDLVMHAPHSTIPAIEGASSVAIARRNRVAWPAHAVVQFYKDDGSDLPTLQYLQGDTIQDIHHGQFTWR